MFVEQLQARLFSMKLTTLFQLQSEVKSKDMLQVIVIKIYVEQKKGKLIYKVCENVKFLKPMVILYFYGCRIWKTFVTAIYY